jgi:hypothetical protein
MQRWLPARAPGSRAVAEKARFPPGRLLEHKIEPHRVAPDETRQKHVEKQTNHHNREGAQPTQRYFLNAQQQLPAQSGKRFDCAITTPTDCQPKFIGVPQRFDDLCSFVRIVEDVPDARHRDEQLEQNNSNPFHGRISIAQELHVCPWFSRTQHWASSSCEAVAPAANRIAPLLTAPFCGEFSQRRFIISHEGDHSNFVGKTSPNLLLRGSWRMNTTRS